MKLAITVPTYDEADNLKKLIPAIHKNLKHYQKLNTTLFIIDDNSPDGTAKVAEELGQKYKSTSFRIEVMHRENKEGLGKAYVYAFKRILTKKFDYLVQMDADLSHNPRYLPALLSATAAADFVVGCRYIKGGSTPDWSWDRRLMSYGGNRYARLLLGSRITDYTSGYNLYSTALLRKLNLDNLQSAGYGFLIELKYDALQNCHNVVQIPIVFMDRQQGVPKLPRGTLLKNLILVPRIRLAELRRTHAT